MYTVLLRAKTLDDAIELSEKAKRYELRLLTRISIDSGEVRLVEKLNQAKLYCGYSRKLEEAIGKDPSYDTVRFYELCLISGLILASVQEATPLRILTDEDDDSENDLLDPILSNSHMMERIFDFYYAKALSAIKSISIRERLMQSFRADYFRKTGYFYVPDVAERLTVDSSGVFSLPALDIRDNITSPDDFHKGKFEIIFVEVPMVLDL